MEEETPPLAAQWDEPIETAVDAVESVLYQKCLAGEIIAVSSISRRIVRCTATD
jgi:hypothetical protein